MAKLLLRVPDDVRAQVELALGRKLSSAEWQTLFLRFLNEELKEKLVKIKHLESIVARSKKTQKQADELADKVNCALSKRYLSESGVKYQEKKTASKDSYAEKMLSGKIECMAICRMRDESRIKKALESQDRIRAQVKKSGTDLTGEIRKWRARDATRT
jgi:cysteinyl-tRNA synthetase